MREDRGGGQFAVFCDTCGRFLGMNGLIHVCSTLEDCVRYLKLRIESRIEAIEMQLDNPGEND